MIEFIGKFFKFGVVGLSGTVIDFFFTWLCKEKLKWNKFISNSVGFTLAAVSNYVFNRIWTFESNNPQVGREFLSFFLVSLIGLLMNNIFLYLFHEKAKLNFYLSKAFAIALVTIWNFLANYLFTFQQV
ncbi:GtrA family protein [Proteiniphilum sp. UBA1028]|jgi:putative flippase GtrA|uniref:GtrA family protein n=1 Tax=Proteiniphilum sp. UBA1028 TaxID=1947251 RepID=UPI000E97D298|nr:GtrA family protein [Proteiniphilum sp. UBA1028]HBG58403.1 glycosyl transferase family 2 [Porphyromonadaceae bacterium]